MTEMVLRFLRQKFGSAGILIALVVLALLSVPQVLGSGATRGVGTGVLVLFLLAAGSVSRDSSGGALQMILSRPIRRTEYLFGRYLGILLSYAIFLAAAVLLSILFAEISPRAFGPGYSLISIALLASDAFLKGALTAAILLFFSTFLPGYGDVLAFFLLTLLLYLPESLGQLLKKPWLSQAARIARENVFVQVPWDEVLGGETLLRAVTGRYVFALTVFLALAALIFSRREFAYGQD